jgi:hypothetical protein
VTIYTPPDNVREELETYMRGVFPEYFADTNIHPQPLSISFENKKGVVSAAATLRWQRQSDYKFGEHLAHFLYQERRSKSGREMYWYCTSGHGE